MAQSHPVKMHAAKSALIKTTPTRVARTAGDYGACEHHAATNRDSLSARRHLQFVSANGGTTSSTRASDDARPRQSRPRERAPLIALAPTHQVKRGRMRARVGDAGGPR